MAQKRLVIVLDDVADEITAPDPLIEFYLDLDNGEVTLLDFDDVSRYLPLQGAMPFHRFHEILSVNPTERQQWLDFHREKRRQFVLDWLHENGIAPILSTEPR